MTHESGSKYSRTDRTHINYTIPQDSVDEGTNTIESYNLRDVPSEVLSRRPMRKRLWQYLHVLAWLLLLCVGGPILLHELYDKYLNLETGPSKNNSLIASPMPCGVGDVWSSWSALFEINLRSGNLSFTAAKLIDVAFDIVVGRGGQACLAWIAYRVYTDVLIRVTEKGQIKYDLFAAIALKTNDTLTLAKTTASIPSTPYLWAKSTLLWMALAMLYVLAYPTLVSAATSPVGATVTSIKLDGNGTAPVLPYIASASYSFAGTGLHDKKDPWIVSVNYVTRLPNNSCDMGMFSDHSYGGMDMLTENAVMVNGTTYTLSNNATTTCGFYYENVFYPFNMSSVHSDEINQIFADRLLCVPDGNHYQWGASWELLVLIIIAQIVWSVSLFLMWLEATAHSPLVRQGTKMSMWRAILELARPLLMRSGPNAGILDQSQLDENVRHMSFVHYEAKVDGGCYQDVCLVSSSNTTTPAEIKAANNRGTVP